MALQPIDLQLLFSQLDNIGKDVSLQKDGAMLREAIAGHRQELRTEIKTKSVNEAQDTKDGLEKIDDKLKYNRKKNDEAGRHSGKGQKEEDDENENGFKYQNLLRDPTLGNYVDISG
ncbi:hypothetical protein AGMMS50212_12110 [Spirochaetia bacterium]|nr:hypothetical protein AGMMS50212_12110 [Spirochaetia bacterium]